MYQDALNALAVVNTEQWFIYEAIILEIISKAKSLFISMQENSSNEPLVSLNSEIAAINRTGFDYWSCVDSNENASSIDVQDIVWERVEEEILRSLILYYHNLIKDNSKFCPHTQIWLINNGFQDKVESKIEDTIDSDDRHEAMKEAMKQWATSSERGEI